MGFETILLLVLVIIFFVWWFKRKKKKLSKYQVSSRKTKDEVWKTIKEYLHKEGKYGYEIVDCFPVKKSDDSFLNPYLPLAQRKSMAELNKIRKWQNKTLNTVESKNNSPLEERYVVCFQVKNPKTGETMPPQAFECKAVKNFNPKPNESSSKIVITKTLDFDEEMKWISPLRTSDIKKSESNIKHQEALKDRLLITKIKELEKQYFFDPSKVENKHEQKQK